MTSLSRRRSANGTIRLFEKNFYRLQANVAVLLIEYECVLSQNYSTLCIKLERGDKTQIQRLKLLIYSQTYKWQNECRPQIPPQYLHVAQQQSKTLEWARKQKKKLTLPIFFFLQKSLQALKWNLELYDFFFLNTYKSLYVCFGLDSLPWARVSSFLRFPDHTHKTTHNSRYYSSRRVIGLSQRPLPVNTQHSQQTNLHVPGGIRTHSFSRWAAAKRPLRPRGHWDRL